MATPRYGSENFSTFINVGGGINDTQTTGLVLTSVTGLDTGGGILGLTWAETLDTSTYEEIEYSSITGLELTGVTRGVNNSTAHSHLNGATVVAVVSKTHVNRLADKLRSVDAVLVQDTSANEIIKTAFVASAVNEITFTNAATGNAPAMSATGGDTDIDLNLIPKGAGDVNIPTGVNIQVNNADPKRALYIPASAMTPATTNGAASGIYETATNKVIIPTYDFDTTTQEFVAIAVPSPHFWDASTVTAQFIWTGASGSGGVVWAAQGIAFSDDDALDTAYGTEQIIADTLITANDDHHTSFTPAITIAGSPVAGDLVCMRFKRVPSNGSDTLGVDARLIGVKLRFGISKYDDQ